MLVIALLLLAHLPQDLPPVSSASDFAHLTHSVTPPKLIHSADPEYTPRALAAQIQGTVVLQAVIGLNGEVTNASVLSSLPGGLDQKALQAIKHWKYAPGSMDTVDIPVLTTVDVVFRLPYQTKRDAPLPLPDDSAAAQLSLAERYEREGNLHQAERYYRMCSATADSLCQFGLGKLLVNGPAVNPNDYAQGIAWLELSKEHGNKQAAALLETAAPKLSSVQVEWVAEVKPHLEPTRPRKTFNP